MQLKIYLTLMKNLLNLNESVLKNMNFKKSNPQPAIIRTRTTLEKQRKRRKNQPQVETPKKYRGTAITYRTLT